MKILQVCPKLDSDGISTLLFSYFSMLEGVQVDFLLYDNLEKGLYEDYFKKKGSRIFKAPSIKKNLKKNLQLQRDVIKKGKYDIVQCHMQYQNITTLYLAKKYKVRIRISHSHIAYQDEDLLKKIKRLLLMPLINCFSTDLWACSRDAGAWTYGENVLKNPRFFVLNNAIDVERYKFSANARKSIRRSYSLENKFVVGCVARFGEQKNHSFLFEIFAEFKKNHSNAVLMLMGSREIPDHLKKIIEEKEINDSILFLGVRDDVPELLSAMDCFVLPSLYEGLGIVYIEAQASGLKCLASNHVPRDICITELVEILSLTDSAKVWSEHIKKSDENKREAYNKQVLQSSFNINKEVERLNNKYKELIKTR